MEELGLKSLKVVITVASLGSFRGAAHELNMSPSSVSHIVAKLEKRLGIVLFLRNTRSVSLTEAGASFLNQVRPAIEQISQAIEYTNYFRDKPMGLIRINATTWGAERLLPIILGFMRKYPDIRVDLVTEGCLVDIIAEGFDAGLRLVSTIPQDMIALSLGIDEALVIVTSPDYLHARGMPVTPGDLLNHECIRTRLPSGSIMRWELPKGRTLREIEVDVSGRLILGTTALAAKAAAQGAGIAYVEQREAQPFLDTGDLIQLLSHWTPPFDGEALYYPRMRLPSASFRVFIDYVKDWRLGLTLRQ